MTHPTEGIFKPIAVGIVVSAVSLVYSISFSSVIFTGPLEPVRSLGILLALAGSLVYAISGALSGSIRGLWWGNQTISAVAIAIGVTTLVDSRIWTSEQELVANALFFISVSTVCSGVLLYVVGRAGLSGFVRFIPHPVIGGFLTATGYHLVLRAAELVASTPYSEPFWGLFEADRLAVWSPFAAAGLMMAALSRAVPRLALMLFSILVYLVGFYAYIHLTGMGIEGARDAGMLLNAAFSMAEVWALSGPGRFALIDPSALLPVLPAIVTTMGLTLLAVLINVSAIEVIVGRSANLDIDFRHSGRAGIVTGLIGGLPGFQSASMAHLTEGQLGAPSPVVGLTGAAILSLLILFGLPWIGLLPVGVFALILNYIGIDILWRWLVDESRLMPRVDVGIVWMILGVTLIFDFATAIAVGLLTAAVMFTFAYSRIDVVRSRVSGQHRLSPAERPEEEIETIVARGSETLIYDLQGYLFFGTSEKLFNRILVDFTTDGAAPRRLILDFRRVVGMDISAAYMFRKVHRMGSERGIEIAYCGLSEALSARLYQAVPPGSARMFDTLEDALTWVEAEVLRAAGGASAAGGTALADLFRRIEAARPAGPIERQTLAPGTPVFHRGEASNSLVFLESGRLAATVPGPGDAETKVASFLPGTVVGEMGFYSDLPRTATVTAETEAVVRRMSHTLIDRLGEDDPKLAIEFHAAIAGLLAKRLGRTTALVVAIDR